MIWTGTIILFLVGLAGTVIPVLPGAGLIFAGALLFAFFDNFEKVEISTIVILAVVAALSQLFDYLSGAYGAKKMGSTKAGVWGSVIGGILGMFMGNVVGLVAGIFLGAVVAEMFFSNKTAAHSLKIGLGSILGFLGGTVAKLIIGIVMIIIFFWALLV